MRVMSSEFGPLAVGFLAVAAGAAGDKGLFTLGDRLGDVGTGFVSGTLCGFTSRRLSLMKVTWT